MNIVHRCIPYIATSQIATAAAGGVLPMLIILGERFGYNPLEGGVDNSYFGKSPSGWMTQDLSFCAPYYSSKASVFTFTYMGTCLV